MIKINWNTKSLEEKLIGHFLRMPLRGVLEVPIDKNNDILFYAEWFSKNDYFKEEGFYINVNWEKRIITKFDSFFYNKTFIKKHNLYLKGSGSNYLRYEQYMNYRILQYRQDYAKTKLQRKTNKRKHIKRNKRPKHSI